MTEVIAVAKQRAVNFARSWPADIVISVNDPGDEKLDFSPIPSANCLYLAMLDHMIDDKGEGGPNTGHITALELFLARNPTAERVLVHCGLGIRRSPSIAIAVILMTVTEPGKLDLAAQAIEDFLDKHPYSVPNTTVIHLLQQHYRLGNDLQALVDRVQDRNIADKLIMPRAFR